MLLIKQAKKLYLGNSDLEIEPENHFKLVQRRRIPLVAIVGFSNDLSSELVDPALTTVAQPIFDLGREVARLVLKEINNEGNNEGVKTNHKTLVLKTQLLIRESTRIKSDNMFKKRKDMHWFFS
jgi:DNA-binding LacI/PurR family transcriptional regulator